MDVKLPGLLGKPIFSEHNTVQHKPYPALVSSTSPSK